MENQENRTLFREEKITKTLEDNYMPYAMSVIVSRAIPEIDGFKPSHRKLLYKPPSTCHCEYLRLHERGP